MPRHIKILLVLLISWIAFMRLGPHSNVTNNLNTVCLFDVTCGGYDSAYAAKVIDELKPDGRQAYIEWHATLDTVLPLLYGTTLFAILAWLATLNGLSPTLGRFISIIPILAAVSDLVENFFVLRMIVSEQTTLAPIASVFTQAKCLLLSVSVILVVGLTVRLLLRRRRSRSA